MLSILNRCRSSWRGASLRLLLAVGLGWISAAAGLPLTAQDCPFADCNRNGIPDSDDIRLGSSRDCNRDRIPDECNVGPFPVVELEISQRIQIPWAPLAEDDTTARVLRVADLDGDDDPDLVLGSSRVGQPGVHLFWNDGTGQLTTRRVGPLDVIDALPIDFDGDGSTEIAVVDSEQLLIFELSPDLDNLVPVSSTPIELEPRPARLDRADLDGDGREDIVLCLGHHEEEEGVRRAIAIWFANEGGVLEPPQVFRIQAAPRNLQLVDMDRDGDTDLTWLAGTAFGISFLENAGGRSFRAPFSIYTLEGRERHILNFTATDLDDDGDRDLVLALSDGQVHVVHSTRADPEAEERWTLAEGHCRRFGRNGELLIADFFGDGFHDVLQFFDASGARETANASASVLLRTADGFGSELQLDPERRPERRDSFLGPARAVDLDGDGTLELLAFENSDLVVGRLALGEGTLDENGNGIPDTCSLEEDARPCPTDADVEAAFPRLRFPSECEDDDFDGDRQSDARQLEEGTLADCNDDSIVDIAQTTPILLTSPFGGDHRADRFADYDGDGWIDLCRESCIRWNVQGVLSPVEQQVSLPRRQQASSRQPTIRLWGDFFGDGLLSALHVMDTRFLNDTACHALFVTRQVRPRQFELYRYHSTLYGVRGATAADFDGDGYDDVLVYSADMPRLLPPLRYRLHILRGSPEGLGAAEEIELPCEMSPLDLVHGDFDGDGRLDAALPGEFEVWVLFDIARAGDVALRCESLPHDGSPLRVGDLENDGASELLTPTGRLYRLDEAGLLTFQRVFDGSRGDTAILQDLDGDDIAEITHDAVGGVRVYTRQQNGLFLSARPTRSLFGRLLGYADFDRDGNLDLATTHRSYSGYYDVPATGLVETYTTQPFRVDLDGDGLADLLVDGRVLRNAGPEIGFVQVAEGSTSFREIASAADLDADGLLDLIEWTDVGAPDVRNSFRLLRAASPLSFPESRAATVTFETPFVGPPIVVPQRLSDEPVVVAATDRWLVIVSDFSIDREPSIESSRSQTADHVFLTRHDLDGDGHQDFLVGFNSRLDDECGLIEHLSAPEGGFETRPAVTVRGRFPGKACVPVDLDGDGLAELVVPHQTINVPGQFERTLTIFRRFDTDPVWREIARLENGPVDGQWLQVDDFTGDGRVDIVLGRQLWERLEAPMQFRFVADQGGGFTGLTRRLSPTTEDAVAAKYVAWNGQPFAPQYRVLQPEWRSLLPDENLDGQPDECDLPVGDAPFLRGDVDQNGEINLTDPVAILSHLFRGSGPLDCEAAADADTSGEINLSDGVYVLLFLFQGGRPPAAPWPECEPAVSELSCAAEGDCT